MLTLSAAQELIRTAVGSKVAGHTLEPDTRFDDVGLTSLEMTEVLFAIEDHLQVEIEIADDRPPHTVGELIELANRMVAPLAGSAP